MIPTILLASIKANLSGASFSILMLFLC